MLYPTCVSTKSLHIEESASFFEMKLAPLVLRVRTWYENLTQPNASTLEFSTLWGVHGATDLMNLTSSDTMKT